MRIAVIVDTFPAVSEGFILQQVTALIDQGHQVEIFAREAPPVALVDPDGDIYELEERLHILGIPTDSRARYLVRALTLAFNCMRECPLAVLKTMNCVKYPDWDALFLLAELHHRSFDLVVGQFGPNGELAARLKEVGFQWPLLTIFRGYDIRWAQERGVRIYRALFQVGDRFLGVSRDIVQQLRSLGVDATRTGQHPGGIDLERFRRGTDLKAWVAAEPLVVLTVARLHPVKGLDHGIRAFDKLRERNPGLRCVYRLVGVGPAEAALRELVWMLGLEKEVCFLGALNGSEIATQYQEAHLFLLPSVAEGLPVALREAMASELPVVATAVGGVGEVVVHGESGLMVPPRDPDALADALQTLVDAPHTWPKMGRRARGVIAAKYDKNSMDREFEQICLDLVTRPRENVGSVPSIKPIQAGKVSVIVPVHNRSDELAECLKGLFSQQRDYAMQVIVIDDASDEEGPRRLAIADPLVTYIRLNVQRGSAYCKNLGLQHADGEFVLFLDSDITFLSETTLTTMVRTMREDPCCGQVGGEAIVDDHGKTKFVFGRNLDLETGASAWQFIPVDQATPASRFQCDYIPTSNCMVRRDVALEVRGFDDAYFGVGEDKDFGYRVKKLGYRSYVLPNSAVYHHFSARERKRSGLTKSFRTQIRFCLRHFGRLRTAKMAFLTLIPALIRESRLPQEHSDVHVQRFLRHHRATLFQLRQPSRPVDRFFQKTYCGWLFFLALSWSIFNRRGLRQNGSVHLRLERDQG